MRAQKRRGRIGPQRGGESHQVPSVAVEVFEKAAVSKSRTVRATWAKDWGIYSPRRTALNGSPAAASAAIKLYKSKTKPSM